jgi:glycosyltransferase involved in cell wall biosynthesis
MRLLIVTQVVDQEDPRLGFFHRWLIEFARHVEKLTVICLYEGVHALPENVTVHSLGKEKGSRSSLSYALAFRKLASELRDEYDHVFVHMNPEYLIIAGMMWKMLGKRTALWYMHKKVSLRLLLGILFADVVFTASPKSMRVATRKKRVVGHGIQPGNLLPAPGYPPLKLLTVGRLSPVKHVETSIETMDALTRSGIDAHLTIVGGSVGKEGQEYEAGLKRMVSGLNLTDRVSFEGAQPHARVTQYFSETHLFLHTSDTGSLDKAALEPLSAGVPILTVDAELALTGIPAIVGVERDPEAFAGAIRKAVGARLWDDQAIRGEAHEYVHKNHELSTLIPRILAEPSFTGDGI